MADDPLFGFKPVQQSSPADDPLMGFKPVQTAPVSGTDPLLTQQPNEGWGASILRHLHGASRAIDDFATFGYGDKGQGALDQAIGAGPTTAQLRSDTNTAYATNPAAVNYGLGAATYAMGPGEAQGAARLGGAVAPYLGKWAGGVLGSAAEGAGAGALGAAGHDEDVGQGANWGGGLGALGGTLGGVVGRGGVLAPASSAADLKAQAQQAYAPLSNILYDATREVHPTLDVTDAQNALRDWSGYKWGDASKTSKEIQTLLDKPQLSANDLQQSQSYLKGIANDGRSDPNDALYAAHYAGKLQDVLENGVPQTGVPAGAGPGYAAQVKAAGDALHGKAQDVERLNNWVASSQVQGGPDVGAQAKSYLVSDKGKTFAPPGTPGYDALNTLAGTAQGPLGGGQGLSLWDLKHHLLWPGIGLVGAQTAGAFGTAEGHQPWWANIPEDVAGLGAGFLLKNRLNAAAMARQGRAIDAAQSALSTGQAQAPLQAMTPLRDALRKIIYGQGAAGNY